MTEKRTEKTDRRVVKTKRAIRSAMLSLMSEKDIDEISVKDIADLADINRKTFYNYYTGVFQLVDDIENEIVDYFAGLIKTTDFEKALADPSIVFDTLYETVRKHIGFVDALFCSRRNASLAGKVISKLIEMTSDAAVAQFGSDPARTETIVRFIFAGEIAVYQSWYHSEQKMPLKELSCTVEALCKGGLDRLMTE